MWRKNRCIPKKIYQKIKFLFWNAPVGYRYTDNILSNFSPNYKCNEKYVCNSTFPIFLDWSSYDCLEREKTNFSRQINRPNKNLYWCSCCISIVGIMVPILDGSSEHVANVWCKIGLFGKKIGFADSFDETKCFQQIELPHLIQKCA